MEHQLTIVYGSSPGHPFDDQIRVMAEMPLGPFEDEGYPDSISGTLVNVPELLLRTGSNVPMDVDLGGRPYRFISLNADGTFELRRDISAEQLAPNRLTAEEYTVDETP